MKKAFLSFIVIVISIQYALFHRAGIAATYSSDNMPISSEENGTTLIVDSIYDSTSTKEAVVSPPETPEPVATQTPPETSPEPSPEPTPTPTPAPVTDTPPPAPEPAPSQGQYIDGVYTGKPANAYYGTVQVEATIVDGRLDSVAFLQHPTSRRTSERINAIAMPRLESEAIQAQDANVSGVSGASYTSRAFRQSLADALSQAKNM